MLRDKILFISVLSKFLGPKNLIFDKKPLILKGFKNEIFDKIVNLDLNCKNQILKLFI